MASLPTTTNPSSSNLQGGLAGLAATLAIGYLTQAGYLATIAVTIGIPQATLAVVLTGIIGAIANVAITHIAELRNINNLVAEVQQLKSYQQYPNDPTSSGTTSNVNK